MGQEPTRAPSADSSLLSALRLAVRRWARHVARRLRRATIPVRGVVAVSFPTGGRLTRADLKALRQLGFVPRMAGAEEPPEPTPDPTPDPTPEPRPEPEKTFPADYVERLRRENAAARTKAKEEAERAAEYERRLRAIEDKDKSELELAKAAAEALQRERDEALQASTSTNKELWRYRAAAKYRVPEDLVDLIGGDTEEETLERAERLGTRIAPSANEPGGRTPPPSPPRGARRDPAEPSVDEQLAAAEKAGDWTAYARLSLAKQSTKE